MGRSNLLLSIVGLATASFCFVAFFHLQFDPTRPENGDLVHRRILFMFDTAANSYPENLTSSSRSTNRFMTIHVAREGGPSSVIQNETAEGEVNSTEARAHSPTLWSVPETCKEQNCAEFLSQKERLAIALCANKVMAKLPGYEVQSSTCKFLPGVGRPPVMLISAEGSGNTWLRGLLEKATGVCTGFQWCDAAMRARGFVGEDVASGKVLVVKTHESTPKWKEDPKLYDSAVFLLRNPAWSLIAEWNRRMTNMENRRKRLPRNDSHIYSYCL